MMRRSSYRSAASSTCPARTTRPARPPPCATACRRPTRCALRSCMSRQIELRAPEGAQPMMPLFWQATDRALRIARSLESIPALLARLVVGVVFVTSGWGKVHNLEKVTAYFTELHIPAPAFQAVFVSYVELICGSLLFVGLASRLSAIPLILSIIVG